LQEKLDLTTCLLVWKLWSYGEQQNSGWIQNMLVLDPWVNGQELEDLNDQFKRYHGASSAGNCQENRVSFGRCKILSIKGIHWFHHSIPMWR